jgi:16S rRNA (uracil1498-N3)-methyltransferase
MRVLIPPGGWAAGQRVSLDDNEVHHLRVRRAQDREIVELLDGTGLRGTGRLVQTGKLWAVEIQSTQHEPRPADLTLAVAAGDRDRFSWMVEKAVELGVTRILPLETARSSGVATGIRDSHLRRLRRQALEATKQCGVAWAVQVEEQLSLDDLRGRSLIGPGWLADRSGAPPPTRLGRDAMTVVIGPEGGLTDAERAGLVAAGYLPIVLSPHTLRFETAALAAAALATTARMRESHG